LLATVPKVFRVLQLPKAWNSFDAQDKPKAAPAKKKEGKEKAATGN
jgi:hypothetical protein